MSTVILQQQGLDYVVNIPGEFIQRLALKPGTRLEIRAEQQHLTLEPVDPDLVEVEQIHQDLMDQYDAAFKQLAE